jgi:hypothetical protein
MTAALTATFHPFTRLPFELRTRIWELTVEPRVVEVHVVNVEPSPIKVPDPHSCTGKWMKKHLPPVRHVRTPTPAPAQLQTCHEAREHLSRHPHLGYQKALSEIMTTPYDGSDPLPDSENDPHGERDRDRYVWLNLDLDMVSIGRSELHEFRAVAHQIRRLRLERSFFCEYFSRTESKLIGKLFVDLTEIHLICLWGIRSGYKIVDDIDFPCGPENVYFVDPEAMGGKMMCSVELDAMMDRECAEFDEAEEEG